MTIRYICTAAILLVSICIVNADELWSRNSKGNALLKKGAFEEALEQYDAAAKIAPQDLRITANRASALYGLKKFEEAAQGYEVAAGSPDTSVSRKSHFNAGDAYFRLGEKLSQSSNPEETPKAQEAFKKAAQNFTDVLKGSRGDKDAKWNLEMSVKRMREMEEKQKQQDKNKKDDKNKDKNDKGDKNKDSNKDQDKKDDQKTKDDQEKKDQEKKNDEDQKKKDQSADDKKDDQKKDDPPKPSPQSEQDKQAAQQLLMQYADDGKDLNKPPQKAKAALMGRPEKDW